ncbi:hypothetical protein [Ruegeria atlantica]|uniref:hypothetical protein n=1 Tax=Ruegeria atlantica TaxID=81569 RepID=UPI00147A1882|nr:hypothetical protein [Ruegeria atlantica]
MTLKEYLSKSMVNTIANGALLLDQDGRTIRFTLSMTECSVLGVLFFRGDWSDDFGRPGLIPVIEKVSFDGVENFSVENFKLPPEFMQTAYDVLQQRLAPEKLYVPEEAGGWMLTSFNSKPLGGLDGAFA